MRSVAPTSISSRPMQARRTYSAPGGLLATTRPAHSLLSQRGRRRAPWGGGLAVRATAEPAAPDTPARHRPRATLRDLFDSLGVYVSAYDTRLTLNMTGGDEALAVSVVTSAWRWCRERGLGKRDIERVLRHFQHSNRYEAFANWETTTVRTWALYDRVLAAARAAEQQAQQQPGAGQQPDAGQQQQQQQQPAPARQQRGQELPADFAAMLLHSRRGLERVTEMLTIPLDELEPFLEGISQRLSPTVAGAFVASLADANPLSFRPSAVTEGLMWALDSLPCPAMDGGGLASFLANARGLLGLKRDSLQRRFAALQEAGGLTAEQAGKLVLAHPELLQTSHTAVQEAAAWLRAHLPPDTFRLLLERDSTLLVASRVQLDVLHKSLRLCTEVLGLSLEACLSQDHRGWLDATRGLLQLDDATLRQRMATLQAATGLNQQQVGQLVLGHPQLQLLQRPHTAVGEAAARLQQVVPPDQLAPLLQQRPGLLVAPRWQLDSLAATLQLWVEVLGVPLSACLARYDHSMAGASLLAHYKESTLKRRMAALRQAAGMTAQQASDLVLQHPELLQKQPAMVKEAGAWLQQHLPDTWRALLQRDPLLLGASEWHLKETAAKLRLWAEVVGVPREAVLGQYHDCAGVDVNLVDLAGAYIIAQERAPDLLRGPDGGGSLAWWRDRRLLLQRLGFSEAALQRMMLQWTDSAQGKALLASLRAGNIEGWPLPGQAAPPAAAPRPSYAAPRPVRGLRSELDEYNLNRIRSMSEKQLRVRISKIKNPSKMRSFVRELEECGLTALAAEAQDALRAM